MLTIEERKIVQFGAQNGKSREEILGALSQFRSQEVVSPPKAEKGKIADITTGFAGAIPKVMLGIPTIPLSDDAKTEITQDLKETGVAIGRQFGESGKKILEIQESETLSLAEKVRGISAEFFKGGSRVFGEAIIGAGKTALSQKSEKKIKGKVEEIGERIAKSEKVQGVMDKYNVLPPDAKREVDNALGFAEGLGEIITFGALGTLKRSVLKTVENVVEKTSKRTTLNTETVRLTTPDKVKRLYGGLNPTDRNSAVKALGDAYQKSFTERAGVSNALRKQAQKQTRKGALVDETKLLNSLAEDTRNGALPYVDGKFIKFDKVMDNIEIRQDKLAQRLDPFLATIPDQTKLSELKRIAESSLRSSRQIKGSGELRKSLRELDRFIDDLEEGFGRTLSAQDLNDIRIGMNSRSGSFDKDIFKKDSAFAIADATRKRLDDITPEGIVNEVNAEWGRLEDIKKTANILHNQTIDVGVLGGQLGRYFGVLGLSVAGLGVGGPGGLVVAGVAAHFGGEVMAQLLRNRRFSKTIRAEMIDVIRRDEVLIQRLISETEGADREFLERILLPAPAETPIPQPIRGQKDLTSKISSERVRELISEIEQQTARSEMQKVLNNQAGRFKTKDTFIKAVRNNPNWLKKFEEAGTTPESVADFVFQN